MEDLEGRVHKFNSLTLPGQIPIMHQGTSYLVNDLWREVQRLRMLENAQLGIPRTVISLKDKSVWKGLIMENIVEFALIIGVLFVCIALSIAVVVISCNVDLVQQCQMVIFA